MANMRQKSVQQRASRRLRHINAIEPFRKKYNCTAAQVFGIIQGIESRNEKLQKSLQEKTAELETVKAELETVKAELETVKAELATVKAKRAIITTELETALTELAILKSPE